jgi:hypothetical protein
MKFRLRRTMFHEFAAEMIWHDGSINYIGTYETRDEAIAAIQVFLP